MRGGGEKHVEAFSYIPLKGRIPTKHQIGTFKAMDNEILHDIGKGQDALYAESGQPRSCPNIFYLYQPYR